MQEQYNSAAENATEKAHAEEAARVAAESSEAEYKIIAEECASFKPTDYSKVNAAIVRRKNQSLVPFFSNNLIL